MKKIGLFGGTFDPVHRGHLRVASSARKKLGLDSVIFIPARVPPHKREVPEASPRDRLAMLKLAIRGQKDLRVSLFDLKRRAPSYTIGTLKYFKRKYPDASLFFIIGSDSLIDLPRWKRFPELLGLCRFAVVPRPSYPIDRLPGSLRRSVVWVKTKGFLISSTDVRRRLREGRNVRQALPKPVMNYIHKKSLYGLAA